MFDKFTDRARKVMSLARQEAQRFNHEYIGTEHILLGLIQEGSGIAARVLKNLDVDLKRVRAETEKLIPHGPPTVQMGQLPFTPRAKRVLELAQEESNHLGHDYIGTEHLLLGLLRENEGVAAQVLMNLGLSLGDLREEILDVLGAQAKKPPTSGKRIDWATYKRRRASATTAECESKSECLTLEEVLVALSSDLACPIPEWPLTRERLGSGVMSAIRSAIEVAKGPGTPTNSAHLFLAVISRLDAQMTEVLHRHGVTSARVDALLTTSSDLPEPLQDDAVDPVLAPELTRVTTKAWDLARALGFPEVQTEHVLVAILNEGDPAIRDVLRRLGVQVESLRIEAKAALKTFEGQQGVAPWEPSLPLKWSGGAQGVLRASMGEGRRLRHKSIGVEHLAWALAWNANERIAFDEMLIRCATGPAGESLRFDVFACDCLTRAHDLALAFGHEEVGEDHLLCALLSRDEALLTDFTLLPAAEARRRAQGAWERLHGRPAPLTPLRGQAKSLSSSSVTTILRASELAYPPAVIDPTDLLLSLTEASNTAATRILSRLHTDVDALRLLQETDAQHTTVMAPEGAIVLSPASVAVVAMAAEEAFALGSEQLDTDHLLLGILRSAPSPAARALACVGVRLSDARIAALEATLAKQP